MISSEEQLGAAAETLRRGSRGGRALRGQISRGEDPLGDALCNLRSSAQRRAWGAFYTPASLVSTMLERAAALLPEPARIVDPGCGSARFLVAAGRRFPSAALVGVELDPLSALLAEAHLHAAGMSRRAEVRREDFRSCHLSASDGPTLFLGNPPYVRHHAISRSWKAWLTDEAKRWGLKGSQLSGLHVHFWLAVARAMRPGDIGVWVTSAEWLDTRYGQLVRALLCGPLQAVSLEVIDARKEIFAGALTTAMVTSFRVAPETGSSPAIARLTQLSPHLRPKASVSVSLQALREAPRWSPLFRRRQPAKPSGWVELGALCRVHRGQATGANAVWIVDAGSHGLPAKLVFPTVTRARELFEAGEVLARATALRGVVDLPEAWEAALDLSERERRAVEKFLRRARAVGAHRGFLARQRRVWWAVQLREPAPILATYMARRPPAFVLNRACARHLNIAHGLYPRVPLSPAQLAGLAAHLRAHTLLESGRTYGGGLAKFEPKDMERLWVPGPELLRLDTRSAPVRVRE